MQSPLLPTSITYSGAILPLYIHLSSHFPECLSQEFQFFKDIAPIAILIFITSDISSHYF